MQGCKIIDFHHQLLPKFETEYRGKIEAKGKGEIDMYFISEAQKPG